MREQEKFKRYEEILQEKYLGLYRRSPRRFGPQIVATGLASAHERHPRVIIPPIIDIDPSSPTFGKLKFVVGLGDNWLI
jgi:hypothetical protein